LRVDGRSRTQERRAGRKGTLQEEKKEKEGGTKGRIFTATKITE
jgi:hypothetical protein